MIIIDYYYCHLGYCHLGYCHLGCPHVRQIPRSQESLAMLIEALLSPVALRPRIFRKWRGISAGLHLHLRLAQALIGFLSLTCELSSSCSCRNERTIIPIRSMRINLNISCIK
jgi:hypothetical protein